MVDSDVVARRLRVLFVPAWYPSEVDSLAGIFIKQHAKAASLYNEIVVLYAYPQPSPTVEKTAPKLRVVEPVGYLDSIMLTRNAKKVLTDSGGLQREAYFAKYRASLLTKQRVGWRPLVMGGIRWYPQGRTRSSRRSRTSTPTEDNAMSLAMAKRPKGLWRYWRAGDEGQ
jgi:hypothetical protein